MAVNKKKLPDIYVYEGSVIHPRGKPSVRYGVHIFRCGFELTKKEALLLLHRLEAVLGEDDGSEQA